MSVLFADLVGFTTLAEGRDPEETRELLSRYFELAREIVERYGGTVEKFIGDAVMAVWGAPTSREDDAERAVRGAMDLVEAVRSLGVGVEARAGVLSGEAAVTIGATGQGMVAGDLVNTASRLQGVAVPGTVIVGETTMRAASAAIVFEPLGEQTLKGKSSPVPAFRAVRVVAERGGRGRSEGLEAPFVGRDEELRMLKELFHATGREKKTRLVSIVGPAGIGKSRLAWEFLKYIDGLIEDVWWHSGRSPAYGEGVSFWALGEMVRRRAGLAETDDEATTRTRVAETVARFISDETERGWVEPALLALLGVGDRRSGGTEELFSAWRTFFERIAATGPTVLVFEDLHWADAGLVDFIGHLLEWSRGLPIYVVTLARPELLDRFPAWTAGKRNFTSITLEPLPEPAMRDLLAGLVPGLPPASASAIVSRADGIPLYAVETVRMLVAEAKLVEEGGTYRPTGAFTELAVPESLTALIAARLDALDPTDRALVQDASVLGQSFSPAALAEVTGLDEGQLRERLNALARREILSVESDPRSPERGQYRFVQGLIREVAYNMLARRDRRTKHLAAARYFESLGTDELAGALATHYLAAHASTPEGPEADALAAQARIALRGAADRAVLLGSHEQAIRFNEQALEVTADPAERAALHVRAGTSASTARHHEMAVRHLRSAVELRRALGDRLALADAVAELGAVMLTAFRVDEAVALLEPAVSESEDLRTEPAAIRERSQLARAYFMQQDNARAIEITDGVLPDAERANLVEVLADTLVTRGSALLQAGRVYEGLAVTRGGKDLAEAHGLPLVVFRALNNMGVFLDSTDPREAMETFRAQLGIAERMGMRAATISLQAAVLETGLRTGEFDDAQARIDALPLDELEEVDRQQLQLTVAKLGAILGEVSPEGIAAVTSLMSSQIDRQTQAAAADALAWVALASGRYREAYDGFVKSLDYATSWPVVHAWSARAALWDGDLERVRAASARLDATGSHGPALEAARLTIRASIAALEGRTAEALPLYRDALATWRDIGLPFDEALTAIDMATVLGPDAQEVRDAAERARQTLSRLGARPFLERLEQILRRAAEVPQAAALAVDQPSEALAER